MPTIKLVKEQGRELTIDQDSEAKLLTVGKQPMTDVLVILQDTGMRPDEVFRIRIENIDWMRQIIFNPPVRHAPLVVPYRSANACSTS